MAAKNKIASMLQRYTNKQTVILVYAVLEWILIVLLLLNSLFTFLIKKFANYFGLKPPCLLCSSLDHVFETRKSKESSFCRDLVCDAHVSEICKLGYCWIHERLGESNNLCVDCLASKPDHDDHVDEGAGITTAWIDNVSCVGEDEVDINTEKKMVNCCCSSFCNLMTEPDLCHLVSVDPSFDAVLSVSCLVRDDESFDVICPPKDEDLHPDRLIPVELIDSSTGANHQDNEASGCKLSRGMHVEEQETEILVSKKNGDEGEINEEDGECNNIDEEVPDLNIEETEPDWTEEACMNQDLVKCSDSVEGAEKKEVNELPVDDIAANGIQDQDSTPLFPCLQEASSSTNENVGISKSVETLVAIDELGKQSEEQTSTKEKLVSTEKKVEAKNRHLGSESVEAEEQKLPETPTSEENFGYLHKKLLMCEKRESANEESLDGSVMSEVDGGDLVLTIERLKDSLNAERKALSALYAELEEERSASAVAANQSMAMINRLQEEKAAMQMEASQYQRMMEEQSEYDQEALQLLNDLMNKKEKEKQELEKELEVYRKKVLDYEATEKLKMIRKIKNGSVRSRTSSTTCSNAEDNDELSLSIDLNREARDEDSSSYENHESNEHNGPGEEVLDLQEIALDCVKQMSAFDYSLTEFEEERLSILDQLKALEEKLLTLGDKELIEDMSSADNSSKLSMKEYDGIYELSMQEDGVSNEVFTDNNNDTEKMTMSSMAKSLLPLLDAADKETEERLNMEENGGLDFVEIESSSLSKFDLDGKKLAIIEEVDHVYERLQALEADREFLKHCMSSMNKGDKGIELLQEILQHLRDLRAVELRMRNMSGDPLE